MATRAWATGLALLAATALPHAQSGGLTGAPLVARAYDAILDVRVEDTSHLLGSTCAPLPPALPAPSAPPAPIEVCRVLDALALWWEMRIDVHDRSQDLRFGEKVEAALAATEAWVAREPRRAEAWFYLGASYGVRAQWRGVRGETVSAARDGRRIKESLERAVALDAALQDARYGIGLYQYYAGVAPTALKLLRWLLLLPGGDRVAGLRAMEQARTSAQVVRSEAGYQLHLIYLWYERQPERALTLVRELRNRYPHNPHFHEVEAEIHDVHRSDPASSLRTWRGLLDAARADRVAHAEASAARARLGAAVQLDRLGDTDLAVDQLQELLAGAPAGPTGIEARAHAALGHALDRLGERAEALVQYRAALTALPAGDPFRTAADARDGIRRAPDAVAARAYRASLDGWRALERGALPEASRALGRALALRPSDPATRYRQARLQLLQRQPMAAIAALESVISDPATPPHVYASACFHAARAHEQQGELPRAVELYRLVLDAFSVDPALKADAERALTRLEA